MDYVAWVGVWVSSAGVCLIVQSFITQILGCEDLAKNDPKKGHGHLFPLKKKSIKINWHKNKLTWK